MLLSSFEVPMIMNIKHLYLVFLLIFVQSNLIYSQSFGTIRGTIYEKENGEPTFGTNVKIKGTGIGASTDINGFFQITKVNPGTITLEVSNIEFKTIEFDVELKAGKIVTHNFYMEINDEMLDEFEINAEAEERRTDVKKTMIQRKEAFHTRTRFIIP